MSNKNTAETHTRFWARMAELYGRKWFDEYGAEIPVSWRELIDKYTPKEIKAGLDHLRLRKSEFVPSLPEVSQQFDAARARMSNVANDPNELRRGFWRSSVVAQVADELGYRFNAEGFEAIVIANRSSLGAGMALLLDELVDSELRTGQRTRGMFDMLHQRSRALAVAFNGLRAIVPAPSPAP